MVVAAAEAAELNLMFATYMNLRWLAQFGNPYDIVVTDHDAHIGIDYGVYGVPESFLIDKAGIIRYKQIGPITAEALQNKIVPLVRELQK